MIFYVYIIAAFWLFGCVSCTVGYVVGRSFRRQAWERRPYVREFVGSSRGGR